MKSEINKNEYINTDYNQSGFERGRITHKKKRVSVYKIFRLIISVLVIVGLVYGAYYMYKSYATSKELTNSEVVEKIGSKIVLPDASPNMVVKVKNSSDLKSVDTFYQDVEDNDYIVIYNDLAVIYRPSSDKLIKVMSVDKVKK